MSDNFDWIRDGIASIVAQSGNRVHADKMTEQYAALHADLARVTAERDEAQKRIRFLEEMGVECVNDWKRIEEQATRITTVEAERDQLREALQAVMSQLMGECDCIYSGELDPRPCPCKLARAALAPKDDPT